MLTTINLKQKTEVVKPFLAFYFGLSFLEGDVQQPPLFFWRFVVPLHSSCQMVVNYEWAEIQGAKEIEDLDRANTLFGNHFAK